MTRNRLRSTVALFAASILAASFAHAHFLFIVPNATTAPTEATIVFGETLEPDKDIDVNLVLGAEMKARTRDGKDASLTLEKTADGGLRVALPPDAVLIHGAKDLGVNARGGKTHRLVYYSKTVIGDAFASPVTIGSAVPVELVPGGSPGAATLRFLAGGAAKADAEVTVVLPDGTEQKVRTDADGRTPAFKQAGRYGGWARHWTDTPGEADGKAYEQLREYAMIVFDVPGTPPAKKEISANQPTTAPAAMANPHAAAPAETLVKATPFGVALPESTSSFGAVVADGWLYVYGGHTAPTHEYSTTAVSGKLSRLDLAEGKTWHDLPAGPPAQGLNLAAHGGRVYRIGGMQPANAQGAPVDVRSLADAARFDPATMAWEPLPALPEPRSSHDVAVIGDTLYVVGGWNLQGSMRKAKSWADATLAIDLRAASPQWRTVAQPFQRRALITAVHGGKLYAIGGFDPEGRPSRRVDVLDPATGLWSRGPGLPGAPINGFAPAACVQDNALLVSVGDGTLYRLDDEAFAWDAVATSTPRIVHRLVPLGGRVLILGGAAGGGNLDLIETVALPPRAPADAPVASTARGVGGIAAAGSSAPRAAIDAPATPPTTGPVASAADAQVSCPVMRDEPVDADSYVVSYQGQPVRLCCKTCVRKWNADPAKYADVAVLPQLRPVAAK